MASLAKEKLLFFYGNENDMIFYFLYLQHVATEYFSFVFTQRLFVWSKLIFYNDHWKVGVAPTPNRFNVDISQTSIAISTKFDQYKYFGTSSDSVKYNF